MLRGGIAENRPRSGKCYGRPKKGQKSKFGADVMCLKCLRVSFQAAKCAKRKQLAVRRSLQLIVGQFLRS